MFLTCASFNVPYLPQELDNAKKLAKSRGVFPGYLSAIREAGYVERGIRHFRDGVVDIQEAFGGDLPMLKMDAQEIAEAEASDGELDIKEIMGKGPKGHPYTADDYASLESTYTAMTTERPFRSQQSELVIRDICRWTLERDKCMAAKEFADAQKIQGMIDKAKESESLRKKDELPQDRVRIDDIVLAIQRAGLHIMDYDELCKELATKAFHKRYPYTRDAADQMLLKIRNATAWNESRQEVERLPDEFAIIDDLNEFAEKPDAMERETYKNLGLYPLQMQHKSPVKFKYGKK